MSDGDRVGEQIGAAVEDGDELRAFLVVLRRALLMICAYIERRYTL